MKTSPIFLIAQVQQIERTVASFSRCFCCKHRKAWWHPGVQWLFAGTHAETGSTDCHAASEGTRTIFIKIQDGPVHHRGISEKRDLQTRLREVPNITLARVCACACARECRCVREEDRSGREGELGSYRLWLLPEPHRGGTGWCGGGEPWVPELNQSRGSRVEGGQTLGAGPKGPRGAGATEGGDRRRAPLLLSRGGGRHMVSTRQTATLRGGELGPGPQGSWPPLDTRSRGGSPRGQRRVRPRIWPFPGEDEAEAHREVARRRLTGPSSQEERWSAPRTSPPPRLLPAYSSQPRLRTAPKQREHVRNYSRTPHEVVCAVRSRDAGLDGIKKKN